MKGDIRKELKIPEKITIKIDKAVKITGPQGEVEKRLIYPKVKISAEPGKIILESKKATKRERRMINSFAAHLRNMLAGVLEKYTYKLKICSGHFPINVSVSNNQLIIKNFLGESIPRKLTFNPKVEVKVEGNEIKVTSPSKELAGQTAAAIETLTRIKKRDIRIFQDGCHITQKAGKEI